MTFVSSKRCSSKLMSPVPACHTIAARELRGLVRSTDAIMFDKRSFSAYSYLKILYRYTLSELVEHIIA